MDLELADKVVVVTGGSAGVGEATVRLLLDEGARVATCARDAARLAAAYGELEADQARRLLTAACDVRERAAVERFVAETAARFGGIDGLVNNAGYGLVGSFAESDDEDWREEMELKLFAVLHPLRAALPHLERSASPRVVNVGAVTARAPVPSMVASSAARAAVLNLSRSLATELAPKRILVNTVSLGVIDTAILRKRYADKGGDQPFEAWVAAEARDRGIPLGRVGRPEEIAPVIALLVSPLASFMTGANVDVAGGAGGYV